MTLVECKKCKGTGIYEYQTKTGVRQRSCKECHGHGQIDIIFVQKGEELASFVVNALNAYEK
jgi:DnaJ-class molecular chaperone